MITTYKIKYKSFIKISHFVVLLYCTTSIAQTPAQDSIQPQTGYSLGQLNMPNPNSIISKYVYDPFSDRYIYTESIGGFNINYPIILTPSEYEKLVFQENMKSYYKTKLDAIDGKKEASKKDAKNLLPIFNINSRLFESIFGGTTIEVIPQGFVEMDIGFINSIQDNPAISPRNRSNFTFDFDQRINLSLLGKVGKRLQVNANYDTESTFGFQNQIKLEYTPTEDDILQKIEVGNVSMPLNSTLITGAQSLFGVKTELQFGKTRVTAVFSEQQSQRQNVTAQGGGTLEEFELFALDYDENRHFFLAQYFRNNYNRALENYPFINSNIQITRLEVWTTNRNNTVNNVRNIVAIQDLGETESVSSSIPVTAAANAYPDNSNNGFNPETIGSGSILTDAIRDVATVQLGFGALSSAVAEGIDYSKLENSRKLNENTDYTLHTQLGYISLNQRLNNDEVLAVAFQFTVNGQVYQIGEFAADGVDATTINTTNPNPIVVNNNLVLKMLKSNITNVNQPVWDLMMKNVYPLNAYQLTPDGFKLDIFYTDPSPVNFITSTGDPLPANVEQTPLLQVFNLDKLNMNNDPQLNGDGFFDFFPGITVNTQNGNIYFTTIEPFGKDLFDKLSLSITENYDDGIDLTDAELATYNTNQLKYVYKKLYTSTKFVANEDAEKNKFQLKGRYKSSGGGGIPIGAFNVPRGSVTVTAGGRQLVEGVDYTVDYQAGRVQILDKSLTASNIPIDISVENNAVFGQQSRRFMGINVEHKFNENFMLSGTLLNLRERPLTQKATYGYEPINNTIVGFNGNFSTEIPFLTRLANKLPNIDTDVPSNISVRGEIAYLLPGSPKRTELNGESTSYIDDFEASQTAINVKSPISWRLSSPPIGFGGELTNDNIASGYKRAKLAWYNIDPIFYSNNKPAGISNDDISTLETRRVFINEVNNEIIAAGLTTVLNTLDLAYYPSERGPYNNNPILDLPQNNWAGITRQLNTTDFEQANVEFMEFWLQDPYFDDGTIATSTGGKLSINLGSISEDVLKDGRKLYENGLPNDGSNTNTTTTNWGKVPTNQALIYAFDTVGIERTNQDIGLDGLNDIDEAAVYTNGPTEDPALDNYTFYLNRDGTILERYLGYNGTQGNSPEAISDTNRGSTTQPDIEDINRDNTMNTINSYYQYELNVTPNMNVGDIGAEFLRDTKTSVVNLPNGTNKTIRWLQFRVPLKGAHAQAINGISDFRTIRFMRLFLSEFNEDVVFRFGTFDLVRGDWRTYTQTLDITDVNVDDDPTNFETGAVNIQQNPNYVLPPGVEQEELFNNNTVIAQNEQSLLLRVNALENNDARAVFKNINIDMLQFKRLKLFIHAGQHSPGIGLGDNELVGFLRMGNDLTDNYYQIEIPLKVSDPNSNNPTIVWPTENEIDLSLSVLTELKGGQISAAGIDPTLKYINVTEDGTVLDGVVNEFDPLVTKYRIAIKGNPTIGRIRTIMLGVKNPSSTNLVSGEIWFNELRLADMDNNGGWAALMGADANIADFANFSATGRRSTIGFGALEQRPNERSRDDVKQYDLVTNINVGQLLPKKWGINIPFNYAVGEETITPQFDPLYQDIELETIIAQDPENEKFYRKRAENYTKRKSINFIGVRKERINTDETKSHFYDVENFTFSYSYNQVNRRTFEIDNFIELGTRTGVNYGHSFKEKSIEPLKKLKILNRSKYFKILKDINFNALPSNISFNTNFTRLYNKQRFRNVDDIAGNLPLPNLYQRNYMFDWQYNVNHNLTKSLQFSFTASRNNIIKNYITKTGIINNDNTIWDDFFSLGDPNRHSQQFQLNYQLPIDKLPIFKFLKTDYAYTGDFQWQKGSDLLQKIAETDQFNNPTGRIFNLGNSIQNAQTHNINSTLNMKKLYKYVGLEKKNFKKTFASKLKNKRARTTKKLKRLNAKDSLSESKQLKIDKKIKKLDVRLTEIRKKSKTKPKANFTNKMYNLSIDLLTSVKKIQITYTENQGSYVPGYINDVGTIGTLKPSFGYTFGTQAENLRHEAARKGWLTLYPNFNEQYTSNKTRNLSVRANLEPINDLKINLVANRTYQDIYTENYRIDNADVSGLNGKYVGLTPNTSGNFAISTLLIKTAFQSSDENHSKAFETFKSNRKEIALRLAKTAGIDINNTTNLDTEGYPLGYGKTSQQVLLPSFLAAYSGQNPSKAKTGIFKSIPIPSWNMKYIGFMKVKWFKKRFKRFSLTHAYKSDYTVNQFRTNLALQANPSDNIDQAGNFKSQTILTNVNLTEQFSPLLSMDFEMKNSVLIGIKMNKDRAMSLSFDNGLMTEIKGNEYTVSLGYRVKDISFKSRLAKGNKITGDLNLKTDISLRDNKTIIRYLDLENNQITAGQRLWTGSFRADYAMSKNLTTILYFDYTFSDAVISTSFPQTTMRGGFTLRYNFGN